MEILLNDILTLKKPHPCGAREWKVLRTGADLRIKCKGCGHELLLPRHKIEKQMKSVQRESAQ